ncbi:DUF3180 domain-containing protein [Corynebacterium sp. L4756]|uniref:DUF3180 domain-containing protein n=1 Tax=unclassified Corynebacterium TaxID=2624378 RepID=UPI00374DD8B9
MKKTSIPALVGIAVFITLAAYILTRGFYGSMFAIPTAVSITLWAMAILCGGLTFKVRKAKGEDAHGIGLDRSQLNPLTIAQFMLVGKASAWTGAIVGSAYLGIALYVVPMSGQIAAAADDLIGVVTSVLGGLAMAIAGIILERHCEVPPPTDGAQAIE